MSPRVTRSTARSVASSVDGDANESIIGRKTPARARASSRVPSTAPRSSPAADQAEQTGKLPHVATSLNTAFGAVGTPAMDDNRLQGPNLALTSVLDNVRALDDDDDVQSPSERAASKSQKSGSQKSASQKSASVRSQPITKTSQRKTQSGLARVDEEEESVAVHTQGQGQLWSTAGTEMPTSVSYAAPALAPTSGAFTPFKPSTWFRRLHRASSVTEGAVEAHGRGGSEPSSHHSPEGSEAPSHHSRGGSNPHLHHSHEGSDQHSQANSQGSEADSQHSSEGSESASIGPTEHSSSITPSIRGMAEGFANFCLDNAQNIRTLLGMALLVAIWGLVVTFLPNLEIGTLFRNMVDSIAEQADRARNASINNTIFDPSLYTRIHKVESDLSSLQSQWTHLQHRLPEHIVLTKDPESGEYIIPGEFYSAFLHQLQHEESFQSGLTSSWQGFLHENEARVQSLIHTESQTRFDNLTGSGVIVSNHTFYEALKEHSLAMSQSIIKQQDQHAEAMDSRIRRLASEVAGNIATEVASRRTSTFGGKYVEDILLLNLAQQLDLQRQRNFASGSLGAGIDYRITSPTYYMEQPNFLAKLWTWLPITTTGKPNHPKTALLPWTEAGECWCAAPSTFAGTAQLGIALARPVRPRALVLEHVHRGSTLDIGSAPKHLEVWGLRTRSTSSPAPISPESDVCTGPRPDAPGNWICLGAGTYDIHGPNEVQKMELHPPRWPIENLRHAPRVPEHVTVESVMVRVMQNWGNDWTCLYRVRVLGDSEEEIVHEERVF